MARKKFEKGSEMFEMFMDYWKLVQDFWIVEKDDSYWDKLVEETTIFCKKYGNENYPRSLALALSNELERRWKDGKA